MGFLVVVILTIIPIAKMNIVYNVPEEFKHKNIALIQMCNLVSDDLEFVFKFKDFLSSIGKTKENIFTNMRLNHRIVVEDFYIVDDSVKVTFENNLRYLVDENLMMRTIYDSTNDIWVLKINAKNKLQAPSAYKSNMFWRIGDGHTEIVLHYVFNYQSNTVSGSYSNIGNSEALNDSCYRFELSIPCFHIFKDTVLIFRYKEDTSNLISRFEMFSNISDQCIIILNGVEGAYSCDITSDSLIIKDLFLADRKIESVTVELCKLTNPPLHRPQNIEIHLQHGEEVSYVRSNNTIRSTSPIEINPKLLTRKEQYLGKQFMISAEFSIANFYVYSGKINLFIILPKDFIGVENLSINFNNRDTNERISLETDQKAQERTFSVELDIKDLNFQRGFDITVFGFSVPGGLGVQQLTLKLIDANTGIDITTSCILEFNVLTDFIDDILVELSDYNIGGFTSIDLKVLVPYINKFSIYNLKFDFGKYLTLTTDIVDNFKFYTLTYYDSLDVDLTNNMITIHNLRLNNNELPTYVHLKVDNVKKTANQAFNLTVKTMLANGYENKWESNANINLNSIELQIEHEPIKINNGAFMLTITLSYNNKVSFDHYLRINIPNNFFIDFNQPCYSNTSLPYSRSLGLCLYGKDNQSDELFNRTSVLIYNALKNSNPNFKYSLTIQGTLDTFVNNTENVIIDIVGVENGEPLSSKSSTVSSPRRLSIVFDCPENCIQCDTSTETAMICNSCDDQLLVDNKTNKCVEELPTDNSNNSENDENDKNQTRSNASHQNIVKKLYIGFYYNFIIAEIVSALLLRFFFNNRFLLVEFLSIFSMICQCMLNYFILAHSWDLNNSKIKISLINVMIILFWLANLIISLYIILKSRNKSVDNIWIAGIKSNSLILFIVYVLFGSGCCLWISAFKVPDVYVKILMPEEQMKTVKNMLSSVIHINLFLILVLTISIASVLFFFHKDSNHMTIIYLINGIITSALYMLLIYFGKKETVTKKLGFANDKRMSHYELSFVKPVKRIPSIYSEPPGSLYDDTQIELLKLKNEELPPDLVKWIENMEIFKNNII